MHTNLTNEQIPMRICSCPFCRKIGAVYSSDPNGQLTIRIKNEKAVEKRRFATKTSQFTFCSDCGVMPFILCTIDGKDYAVINLRCCDDMENFSRAQTHHFSDETIEERLKRRKATWTGDVKIIVENNP
jgi:hypothetical protein